ncbi:MAG: DUF177 domain-containing protein [Selenomonadaceae bacterium]|nr:DUF177 domain-containing protein [Selenomonadaceae bacterium]MBQ7628829.1 DUF177 domain-containing protein [Selenomonadaceae bacterium]
MLKVQIGKGVNAQFSFEESAESLIEGDFSDAVKFVGKVEIVGEIVNDDSNLKISGKIYCRRKFNCDRCLTEAEENQVCEFEEEISQAEISDGILDITELVRDTLIAAQPIKNLCKADCKGLCPKCGQNLNEKECNCQKLNIDSRLAPLLKFKSV